MFCKFLTDPVASVDAFRSLTIDFVCERCSQDVSLRKTCKDAFEYNAFDIKESLETWTLALHDVYSSHIYYHVNYTCLV